MEYNLKYVDPVSKSEMKESLERNYLIDEPLTYSVYEDVTLSIEGVAKFPSVEDSELNKLKGKYIFLGVWSDIWGHCITDNLKKIWILNIFESRIKNRTYKLLVYNPLGGVRHIR